MLYLIIIISILTIIAGAYAAVISLNARINKAADLNKETATENKLVTDQNGKTGSVFRYGLYHASYNGCEAIAVHNARVLCGYKSTLSGTMKRFQRRFAMVGFGVFGSYPRAIGRILRSFDTGYKKIGLDDIGKPGVYIVSFWNDRIPWDGIHTVAFTYNGKVYSTYNLHGNGRISYEDPHVYAKKYICGYSLRQTILSTTPV